MTANSEECQARYCVRSPTVTEGSLRQGALAYARASDAYNLMIMIDKQQTFTLRIADHIQTQSVMPECLCLRYHHQTRIAREQTCVFVFPNQRHGFGISR